MSLRLLVVVVVAVGNAMYNADVVAFAVVVVVAAVDADVRPLLL